MASLSITIDEPKIKRPRRIIVEMDANRFERLAADLGLFKAEFLKSVEQAEKDYRAGKVKKISSLKELRK